MAAIVLGIFNASPLVSTVEAGHIVDASNIKLPEFCKDWSLFGSKVVLLPSPTPTNPASAILKAHGCTYALTIKNTSDVKDALGYHIDTGDVPTGFAFAKTVLDAGGKVLYNGPTGPTLAQCVFHEILELLRDLRCNEWWADDANDRFIAAEVADPVQGGIVPVQLPGGVIVGLSDWVLPAWADPDATHGPYNHLGNVTAPFECQEGGYLIVSKGGVVSQQFGAAVPEWVKKVKADSHRHKKRLHKRVAAHAGAGSSTPSISAPAA